MGHGGLEAQNLHGSQWATPARYLGHRAFEESRQPTPRCLTDGSAIPNSVPGSPGRFMNILL